MWDFSSLRFIIHPEPASTIYPFTIRTSTDDRDDQDEAIREREEAARKRKQDLPAAFVLYWDDKNVTIYCPFCARMHNHGFTHFKYDFKNNNRKMIQDDHGRYAYDGPSPVRCESRVSHCDRHHVGINLQYVLIFPFENDARAERLSYEIEQMLGDDGSVRKTRFRTVGLSSTIIDVLEELEGCSSDETPEEREMRIRMQSISLDNGDYDVTDRDDIEDTQRASDLVVSAAYFGHLHDLKRLLDNSPNRNGLLRFQDKDGQSLLGLAVQQGQDAIVKYLLKAGSDINVTDAKGRTPLMEAALWGFPKTVDILLRAGANQSLGDRRGMTAAKLAEESERNDYERHERCLVYSEDPYVKKRDRRLIRGLLNHQVTTSLPKTISSSDLIDAYFHKSPAAGTISFVMPKQGIEIYYQSKTAAILLRGGNFPPIAAISGYSGSGSGEFRSPEDGFEMLNQGYWAYESLEIAENIGFSFEQHHHDKQGFPGIYNACHAESQAMCFFVKKNYLFRDYEEGEDGVDDDFLQLFMLQPRNRHAEIIVSNTPCRSCIRLKNRIFERLKIEFTFKTLPVR